MGDLVGSKAGIDEAELAANLAEEFEGILRTQHLDLFFPRCIDQVNGGFFENFDREWRRGPDDSRHLVYQSRMTWLAAKAAEFLPSEGSRYKEIALHGLEYLCGRMSDPECGGLFLHTTPAGQPTGGRNNEKTAYSMVFAIYAAAAVHSATGSRKSLELAMSTAQWLFEKGHDDEAGGYWEAFSREGVVLHGRQDGYTSNPSGGKYGFKSQNTHLHLLEAFAELSAATPDPTVRSRLEELLVIVRDKMTMRQGYMNLYFDRDWRTPPAHNSFGHDVEAAYLLVEASHVAKRSDAEETWTVARALVDHALEFGWDTAHGGFFDSGDFNGPVHDRRKVWWVQMEGMNALLLLHSQFRAETSVYWERFLQQWGFIRDHLLDKEFGGFYDLLEDDGRPLLTRKAHGWKAGYHDGRALMNCVRMLRAGVGQGFLGNP